MVACFSYLNDDVNEETLVSDDKTIFYLSALVDD